MHNWLAFARIGTTRQGKELDEQEVFVHGIA